MVAGMQHQQAHALQHTLLHTIDQPVADLLMRHMAPPEQHVGIVEHAVRQALVGIVKRATADFEIRMGNAGGNRAVDAIRIDILDLLVKLLVASFVPDRNLDRHVIPRCFRLWPDGRPDQRNQTDGRPRARQ